MKILFVIIMFFLVSCSNSLPKFDDIQADKTRPIAVIVDPPEAAPGDTVHVRYLGFSPDSATLSMHWTAALDFSLSNYGGTAVESHIISLDSLMLPGSKPFDFYFIVPDSTLLYSTYLKSIPHAPWDSLHLTLSQADSILKLAVKTGLPLAPPFARIADMIGADIKINVHISAEYPLDVYKYMTIRYTRDLKSDSANVNRNPVLHWLAVYDVAKGKVNSFDSVPKYPYIVKFLYADSSYLKLKPVAIWDTIDIDSGHSYFMVADSGINAGDTDMQTYRYISLISDSVVTAQELYDYQWFYKDLDYRSPMVYDSLILFSGSNAVGNATKFLTPTDTAMHHFEFYCVVRDSRQDFEAVGESEYQVTGYFRYSDAYARSPHDQ
jgi:hypothetical protein